MDEISYVYDFYHTHSYVLYNKQFNSFSQK